MKKSAKQARRLKAENCAINWVFQRAAQCQRQGIHKNDKAYPVAYVLRHPHSQAMKYMRWVDREKNNRRLAF